MGSRDWSKEPSAGPGATLDRDQEPIAADREYTDTGMAKIVPSPGDALIVVDVQRDFLPGGALGVARGDEVVAPLNEAMRAFERAGRPVFASRDWHTPDHCSFKARGGPWPPHCVAGTPGARFAESLRLPDTAIVVSKADSPDADSYSAFGGTDLAQQLSAEM